MLDTQTCLMWQRDMARDTSVDAGTPPLTGLNWQDAQDYCSKALNTPPCLAGYCDWRLPTKAELLSIVDTTKNPAAINLNAFPGTPADWCWSSSTHEGDPGEMWVVSFKYGYGDGGDDVSHYNYVRCVR